VKKLLTVSAVSLILLSGCGKDEPEQQDDKPLAPVAVKTVRFGSSKVEVERVIGELESVGSASGLNVYRRNVPEGDGPLRAYLFFLVDGQLAECQVVYDTVRFNKEIGRENFYGRIEMKYGAKEDFGATDGKRRWLSLEDKVTLTWQDDFDKKISILTVAWGELEQKLAARRRDYQREQANKRKQEERKPDKSVDIGI